MNLLTSTGPLAFQASGPQDAPAIVFLHGGGVAGWMWQPVIRQLPDYRCLAPDLPEHGDSHANGPFRIETAAPAVAELIATQTPAGKAVVVGLSAGAQVGVQLLATAPECIDKAIISSALVRPMAGLGWASSPALLAWTYRLTVRPFINNDWWIRLNMKYSAGLPDEFFPPFKHDFQRMTESAFVNTLCANQHFRLPEGLEKAATRTLVVAGNKEPAAMRQSARDLVSVLPHAAGATFSLGPHSSKAREHNWAITAPELFAQTVRAWVEDRPLPRDLKALNCSW